MNFDDLKNKLRPYPISLLKLLPATAIPQIIFEMIAEYSKKYPDEETLKITPITMPLQNKQGYFLHFENDIIDTPIDFCIMVDKEFVYELIQKQEIIFVSNTQAKKLENGPQQSDGILIKVSDSIISDLIDFLK